MGSDRKKRVAAAVAVLEVLRREKERQEGRKDRRPVSNWALSGRIDLMAAHGPLPFRLMQRPKR